MRLSTQTVLASSRRYLDLIGGKPMSESEMHAFIGETVDSYEKHVNRGFILEVLNRLEDVLKEIQIKRFGSNRCTGPDVFVGPATAAKYAVLPGGANYGPAVPWAVSR